MDKEVRWMPQSFADLKSIAEYIGRDSEYYASLFVERIIEAGNSLTEFYKRGRIVPEKTDTNIREIFEGEYRIIYQVTDKEV
jgi:plasmid stabilization system protein ParE